MTPKVGSNRQAVRMQAQNKAKSSQKTAKPQPKPTVPVGQQITSEAKTKGAPVNGTIDGQTGQVIYNIGICNDCDFTVNIDNHIEVKNTGKNSNINVGDGVQAIGENINIEQTNIGIQPNEKQPTVKEETLNNLRELGLPQEDIDRLVAQEEFMQSHIKADMKSVKSIAIMDNAKLMAKMAHLKGDEYHTYMNKALQRSENANYPETLDNLMQNTEFAELPQKDKLAFLQSGLPASAISDLVTQGYNYVQYDKENKQLKVGCGRDGIMIKFDTSDEEFLKNVQIGVINLPKASEGKFNLDNEIRIEGAKCEVQLGFDPLKEFGDTSAPPGWGRGAAMTVTFGRGSKLTGITANRPFPDSIRFAENSNKAEQLEGQTTKNIYHNFTVHITDNAKQHGYYRNATLLTADNYTDASSGEFRSGINDGDNFRFRAGTSDRIIKNQGEVIGRIKTCNSI